MAASDSLPAGCPLPGSSPVIGVPLQHHSAAVPGRGGPPLFPSPPSTRSTPPTPGGSSGLLPGASPFHGLHPEGLGSAPPLPRLSGGHPNDAAGFASCCGPCGRSPYKGFRHRASTRTVSRPSRRSATGPPGSYPDRTCTGWRRRACLQTTQVIPHRPSTSGRTPVGSGATSSISEATDVTRPRRGREAPKNRSVRVMRRTPS